MLVNISEIKIKEGRRLIDDDKVKQLADSINEIGLINPVTVDGEYNLIAGAHRIEAAKLLGRQDIEAVISPLTGLKAELAEIDENIIRSEYHYIERGKAFKKRKEIYETLYPDTKAGVAGGKASGMARGTNEIISFVQVPAFSQDTADQIGVSPRTVEQEIQIAENLTEEAQEVVISNDIAKTDALKLARLEDGQNQVKVAGTMAENNITFEQAVKKIHQEQRHEGIKKRYESAGEITGGKILEGDLFEKITEVPDNSVDLLFADPPYMVLDEQWDAYDSVESFMQFTKQWLDAVMPKVKPTGRVYISFAHDYQFRLYNLLADNDFYGFNFGQMLIWHYRNNNKPFDRYKYRYTYEPVFYLYGSEAEILNLPPESYGETQFNVWTVATPQSNFGEGKYHPAQKPLELLERIILTGSREGDTVLDPFGGSGTTGVAARKLNRGYILIERESEYCRVARGRLSDVSVG